MLLQLICAFFATFGFTILFNIERKKSLAAAVNGAICWIIYLLVMKVSSSDYLALFVSSFALGVYSELMAYKMKSPSTIFSIPALIPLVPGAYIYYTILAAVKGNPQETMNLFIITVLKSVSLALGMLLATGFVLFFRRVGKLSMREIKRGLRHE